MSSPKLLFQERDQIDRICHSVQIAVKQAMPQGRIEAK